MIDYFPCNLNSGKLIRHSFAYNAYKMNAIKFKIFTKIRLTLLMEKILQSFILYMLR